MRQSFSPQQTGGEGRNRTADTTISRRWRAGAADPPYALSSRDLGWRRVSRMTEANRRGPDEKPRLGGGGRPVRATEGGLMIRRRFPRRARVAVALSAAVAALIIAAIIASAGSAQPPTTLHLVARSQKGVGFFPNHKPHQGDRFGFGDKITGDDTGVDRGVCTFIDRKAL